jgi:hypothetical protein
MKQYLAIVALAFLAACATVGDAGTQLQLAYNTVNGYVDVTKTSLARGRISPEQAEQASANAKKAVKTLDTARIALDSCEPKLPCTEVTDILKALQPDLLEFERQLREQEGKVK